MRPEGGMRPEWGMSPEGIMRPEGGMQPEGVCEQRGTAKIQAMERPKDVHLGGHNIVFCIVSGLYIKYSLTKYAKPFILLLIKAVFSLKDTI